MQQVSILGGQQREHEAIVLLRQQLPAVPPHHRAQQVGARVEVGAPQVGRPHRLLHVRLYQPLVQGAAGLVSGRGGGRAALLLHGGTRQRGSGGENDIASWRLSHCGAMSLRCIHYMVNGAITDRAK